MTHYWTDFYTEEWKGRTAKYCWSRRQHLVFRDKEGLKSGGILCEEVCRPKLVVLNTMVLNRQAVEALIICFKSICRDVLKSPF